MKSPRALLAGDHFQLPPTILCVEAERQGLGHTLMERVLARADGAGCVRMLTTQYRMHEDIMKWSSDKLYDGKLKADDCVSNHLLCHLAGVDETPDTSEFVMYLLYLVFKMKLN